MMGLLEAAQNYSSGRGASFETYAGIRIRGAMLDALRKLDWAPRSVHRKARAAALALREVESRLGAQATETDVATELGVSLPEYQRVLQDALGCQLLRFNEGEPGEESPLDRVADAAPDPERLALDESRRKAIAAAIERLPERERLVLSLYYEHELNLKEIGAVLKVTESRICQLHGQALLRLRALDAPRTGIASAASIVADVDSGVVVDLTQHHWPDPRWQLPWFSAPSSRVQACTRWSPQPPS